MADVPIHVVPTRNVAEGIAAMMELDGGRGGEANATAMTEAGRAIQTLQATEAVRDATVSGKKVKKGQTIVLDPDDGLLAADTDPASGGARGAGPLSDGYSVLTHLLRRRRDARRRRGARPGSRTRTAAIEEELVCTAASRTIAISSPRSDGRAADATMSGAPRRAGGGRRGAGATVCAEGPGTRPHGPRRAARRAARPVGSVGGADAPSGRAPPRHRQRSRPVVPPAAPLRRPARDAPAGRSHLGRGRHGRERARPRAGRPRRAGLSAAGSSGRSPSCATTRAPSRRRGSDAATSSAACSRARRSSFPASSSTSAGS